MAWFSDEDNLKMLAELEELGVKVQNETDVLLPLAGKSYIVTGTLESMGREEAEDKLRELGATVTSSVTKTTTALIVGEKPGKTIHVNYFTIDKKCYFVDLPGYGYAQVSQKEKERWGKLMEDYFAAGRIDLGILIVDHRHAPTNNDITMARWFIDSGCPFVVVANKLDKMKKSQIQAALQTIRQDLELPEECPIISFSAEKGDGKDALLKMILDVVEA